MISVARISHVCEKLKFRVVCESRESCSARGLHTLRNAEGTSYAHYVANEKSSLSFCRILFRMYSPISRLFLSCSDAAYERTKVKV